jgi:hypothetical protein
MASRANTKKWVKIQRKEEKGRARGFTQTGATEREDRQEFLPPQKFHGETLQVSMVGHHVYR